MKDDLGRKIMIKFVGLRAETCSYLIVKIIVKIVEQTAPKCVS